MATTPTMSMAEQLNYASQLLHQLANKAIRYPVTYAPAIPPPLPASVVQSRPFQLRGAQEDGQKGKEGAQPAANNETQVTVHIKQLKAGNAGPLALRISLLEGVSSLKALIAKHTSIGVEEQRLVFGGKGLVDGKALCEYGIEDGATIHLMRKAGASSVGTREALVPAPSPLPVTVPYQDALKKQAMQPEFWAGLASFSASRFPQPEHRRAFLDELSTFLRAQLAGHMSSAEGKQLADLLAQVSPGSG